MAESDVVLAKLNQVVDLLGAIQAGRLRDVVTPGLEVAAGGCDYRCDCNHSYCGCRGSVSKRVLEQVSFPEFLQIREERIKDLREQLAGLEMPQGLEYKKS
ncbi:MAG: hypothetical protein M3410_15840 [Acidobacteriota bacterium]|nr:hypothetical protein [Acidobacteriota bacterium]